MRVRIAMCTDKGPRENLEDTGGAFTLVRHGEEAGETHVLGVFDGVCSEEGGEIASSIGRSAFEVSLAAEMAFLSEQASSALGCDYEAALKRALAHANDAILHHAENDRTLQGMSTTAVVVLICDDILYVAWVGDSRCYWIGQDRILQVTKDHTEVNRLIDAGLLNRQEAVRHPMAHAINRFLGQPTDFLPETISCRLEPGNMVLACTDGLSDAVTDAEILELVGRFRGGSFDFAALPLHLVQLALANGTGDNCTVLCCECLPEVNLPMESSGRTLTSAYPVQIAHVLRNLRETRNEYPDRKAAQKQGRASARATR